MSQSSAVLVTLVILKAGNPALSQDSAQLIFNGIPTSSDLSQNASAQFAGLVDTCEVPEIAEYLEPHELANGNVITLDCYDNDSNKLGYIVVETQPLLAASTVSVED